jgi:hypothetical protein
MRVDRVMWSASMVVRISSSRVVEAASGVVRAAVSDGESRCDARAMTPLNEAADGAAGGGAFTEVGVEVCLPRVGDGRVVFGAQATSSPPAAGSPPRSSRPSTTPTDGTCLRTGPCTGYASQR